MTAVSHTDVGGESGCFGYLGLCSFCACFPGSPPPVALQGSKKCPLRNGPRARVKLAIAQTSSPCFSSWSVPPFFRSLTWENIVPLQNDQTHPWWECCQVLRKPSPSPSPVRIPGAEACLLDTVHFLSRFASPAPSRMQVMASPNRSRSPRAKNFWRESPAISFLRFPRHPGMHLLPHGYRTRPGVARLATAFGFITRSDCPSQLHVGAVARLKSG